VPDVVDDHYYLSAGDMARTSNRYDNANRSGPKVFVGEWAAQGTAPTPSLALALGDAAWLTGLERNSDHVIMQCYAPLLVNVNPGGRQWSTNLMGYDALQSFGSPSYWAQVMFAHNTGDTVLPSTLDVAPVSAPVESRGQIGVGTWATQAEYKDVRVTSPEGQTLYSSDFNGGKSGFATSNGDWQVVDGALRQVGNAENTRAVAGDVGWKDYTISLKARKISGAEGFLVLFRSRDAQNYSWWNIGGWGNTRTAVERSEGGGKSESGTSNTTVETGRWYDLRLEVSGKSIRGYIDGKLVTSATDTPPAPAIPVYAAASRDSKSGDTLLKVVNTAAQPYVLQVDLAGARSVAPTARAQVLVGDPSAMNSIEEPTKVAPRNVTISGLSRSFRHNFPAHSVTVMRLKTR
jgi:alpha-L-arabinofuranosidase